MRAAHRLALLPLDDALAACGATLQPLPSEQPFTRRDGIVSFVTGVLLIVLATPAAVYRAALRGGSVNPDSLMRLVRLREMLAAGRMLDVVARDGSGSGTVIHWSHLVDLLVWLPAAPLHLLVGWNSALGDVTLIFGPASFGALCVAAAWAVAPLTARPWRFLTPLLLVASPAIFSYAMPGVVHHHVLLVLCAVVVAGWTGRVLAQGRGAAPLGVWCGIGLWLSPEIMPFVLFAFATLFLHEVRQPALFRNTAMRDAGAAMLCIVIMALVLDPAQAGLFSVTIDRLSVPFVVMAGACWLSGCIMASGFARSHPHLVAVGAVLPLLGWLALFPGVAEGPAGLMPAEQARAFFGSIEEMRPISTPADLLRSLWSGLLALIFVLAICRCRPPFPWLWIASLVAGCLALGCWHVRFAAYAGVLGATALPVAMTATARPGSRLSPGTIFCLFVVGPALGGMLPSTHHQALDRCPAPPSGRLLTLAAHDIVLASPDLTPDLLYRSDVSTVGSLFHRNVAAFMRLRAAWRSVSSLTEPDAVSTTRAQWILACQGSGRDALVVDLPHNTLEDALKSGNPPSWLDLVTADGNWRLWRVR